MDGSNDAPLIREHGMPYKLVYIAAVLLHTPLLTLGGILAGIDVFVQASWLTLAWMGSAALGIFLYGLAKVMDHDDLRGLPGSGRALMWGLLAMIVGAAVGAGAVLLFVFVRSTGA